MSDPVTAERFLQTLARSGLMTADAVREVVRAAPREDRSDPQKLAELFVRTGKLSHFQARKLMDGTASGLVLGHYHIVMPIGRGGMGTVYLAREADSPRLLALKVLPPAKARASDRLLARFRREMELCRRVSHPNITQTFDAGVQQGVYYIAMEYIAGVSLYRVVATSGALSVGRAAKLFAQAAAGLAHAHEQGLIHRDLKPSNLMVTPRDQVKVLDLGLALVEGEAATDREIIGGKGYVVGTMDYVAPEQTKDAVNVGPRADLYSLGCTLFFALTGQPPFPGGTAQDKIRRHRKEAPRPVQDLNPLVPAEFAAVVHQMLAKDPDERPASALAVRATFLRYADPEPPPYISVTTSQADPGKVIEELEAHPPPESESGSKGAWDWLPTEVPVVDRRYARRWAEHALLGSIIGATLALCVAAIAWLVRR